MACCTVLKAARGSEAGCVCRSVCLYNAFHVPHISLPFISPPPLRRFGGGVQSASRINFQLVLVQILILKKKKGWGSGGGGGGLVDVGWGCLSDLASDKTRGRNGREKRAPVGFDAPLQLFALQLRRRIVPWKTGRKSQVCRVRSKRPPLLHTRELTAFIIQ